MPIALGCLGRQKLCRAHPNAGQLVIGKSGSPPRCAGRCRSHFAESDVQIVVARKLQVPVVIATPLAAKFAVLVARSYSAAFLSIPKSSARLRGDAPVSALPHRRDLGRSRSIKKWIVGRKLVICGMTL